MDQHTNICKVEPMLDVAIPNITKKMLTTQLRELEEHDIIQRVVHPVVPPKMEYSITDYGRTLDPILAMMHQPGSAHEKYIQLKKVKYGIR